MRCLFGWLLLILTLQACAITGDLEAQQLAYDGQGPDPCVWGGVSKAADAHCTELRWGTKGYLMALNERAIQGLPSYDGATPCQDHVERLETMLTGRPDLRVSRLFSCPPGAKDNRCHLSLLVTDARGGQYVLDNGAVIRKTDAALGVGTLQQFAELTHGDYRVVAYAWEVAMPAEDAGADAEVDSDVR